jgi:hypothetical protein
MIVDALSNRKIASTFSIYSSEDIDSRRDVFLTDWISFLSPPPLLSAIVSFDKGRLIYIDDNHISIKNV